MTRIYLIDDYYSRHQQLNTLITELNKGIDPPGYASSKCPQDEDGAREYAKISIGADVIWQQLSLADSDSIFLIDFKLSGVDESSAYKFFNQKITTEAANGESWATEALKLIEGAFNEDVQCYNYATAVIACAVVKAKDIPAILISTAAATEALVIAKSWKLPVVHTTSNTEWPVWRDEILKSRRHTDSIIQNILRRYGAPVNNDLKCWDHDYCEKQHYCEVGGHLWKCGPFDRETNKAFHRRRSDAWAVSDRPSRPIKLNYLKQAVECLNFGCEVQYKNINDFCFPVEPGITFLLSLREFVLALGEPKPQGLVFSIQEESLHSFELVLNRGASRNLPSFFKRFLGKDWRTYDETFAGSIREHIPAGGLSEAIFHCGHCRLNEIKGEESWVQMFRDGSKKWAVWPSMSDRGIIFHWWACVDK